MRKNKRAIGSSMRSTCIGIPKRPAKTPREKKRESPAMMSAPAFAKRVPAPRSLWDANYKEKSWIVQSLNGQPINLLPREMGKIEKHYPGTKLAFTEYDYGGVKNISGAIAEADVLGIFGRDGVFAAAHWGNEGDFLLAAYDSYLNFDGRGGAFGNEALQATSSKIEDVSVYASKFAQENKNDLVVVLINRSNGPRPCKLNLANFTPSKMSAYRLSSEAAKLKSVAAPKVGEPIILPTMSVTTLLLQK